MMKHRPQHFLQNRAEGSGAEAAHVLGSGTASTPRSVAGVVTGAMSRSATGWEAAVEALAEPPPMQRSTEQPVQRLATADPSSLFPQAQLSHHSLRGPPAATSREAFLRERLAAQDEQRQQQRLYHFEQQASERHRHLQHLQEQQWLTAQQQHLQHLQHLQSLQEQQWLQSAAVQPQSQSLVQMIPGSAPLGHSPDGAAPFPRSTQFSQALALPVSEASAESGTVDASTVVAGGSDETQTTLTGVRDILTQFSEEISQVLAQSVMAQSEQVQTQRQQQNQQQQEGDAEEGGEGYAYTIGGHAVQQQHQHASRQAGSRPADRVPVHGNEAYIGGNSVNQWGELTGNDRMPKTHQQQRRQQQTQVRDEARVNPQSSASPSTAAHLRAVSPSPHLGVHARSRASAYHGGRGARELPRESGWPGSRPGEGAAGHGLVLRSPRAATSSSPAGDRGRHGPYHSHRHQGRVRVRSNGRHVDGPARRHRHAEQRRVESDYYSSDDYEAQRFEVDEDHESAYDSADDEHGYSSSGGIQHAHRGEYEDEQQSEGDSVRGHRAQDSRQYQPARARTRSRRHTGAQDHHSQRSSSRRSPRDHMHAGARYDSGGEFRVPLP